MKKRTKKLLSIWADDAFETVADAVSAGAIPGAVFGLLASGEREIRVAGQAQITPTIAPMTASTWFDLASLTKVMFTTPAILRLVAEGRIGLDDRLTVALPDLRQYDQAAPERHLTFRQCLSHQTHLPAVEPLYTYGQDPATLRAFILQRVFPAGPPCYSDINFMLLGIAIERLTGQALDQLEQPPGLSFRPESEACAATELCTWRGRVMRGEVHDENAFALGGAAGHAGLFGTIDGVLDFAASRLFTPEAAPIRVHHGPRRTIGWEARHDGWFGGDACSHATIGHTGFTGTALWIDFAHAAAWALLTNRVHPTRHRDTGIAALRRQVGDRVARAAALG